MTNFSNGAEASRWQVPRGVLDRGLVILETFAENALRLHLKDFAERTGMDKATILRMLKTLQQFGYVHKNENGSYSPGPALLRLGALYRATFDLNSRMQPVISEIRKQTRESVAFYVRSENDRVCLYRQYVQWDPPEYVDIGRRIPLTEGGSSAHILRTFTGERTPRSDEILKQGYVITHGEREKGITSVAMPVFDGDGTFLGALIVTLPTARYSSEMIPFFVDAAARELAAQGFSMTPPQTLKTVL